MVRRAIETDAPLLAAALHRLAIAEKLLWEELAVSLDCVEDDLNRLACCKPPRSERYDDDVRAIAAACGIAMDRLLPLLGRLCLPESGAG
jgi:hypothetical protein